MTRARGTSRPRLRLLPTILLTLAILALPTVVYAWGRASSSFGVVTVTVSGTDLVPRKKALKLLRRQYVGRNLFTVTAADVRKTLTPFCFVSGVRVDRDFPDTLSVTVDEHRPVAYVLSGDRWFVVDAGGHVICRAAVAAQQLTGRPGPQPTAAEVDATGTAATEPGTGVPAPGAATPVSGQALEDRLLAGPARAALALPRLAAPGRIREGASIGDRGVTEMLGVIVALPRSLQRSLATVRSEQGQIELRFADGLAVRWGDAERTLAKTVALRTVLRRYASKGTTCTFMDLSIPDKTLARPVLQ